MTALKWALPVWLLSIIAVSVLMFFTDFVTEIGTAEAIKRLVIIAFFALPLVAWLIKASIDDIAAYRVAWKKRDPEEGRS